MTGPRNKCVECSKKTNVAGGWHLCDGTLNFCSNACVADYIERTEKFLEVIQKVKS